MDIAMLNSLRHELLYCEGLKHKPKRSRGAKSCAYHEELHHFDEEDNFGRAARAPLA
jgi:hypothetical protein